jgi:molecular chaperone HscB
MSSTPFKVLDSAVPVSCWACSVGHIDSTLFCPHCSKIQPPPGGDYFSVFGLKPRLNLDLTALETEFHRLSRKLHPDRFVRATENEKQWSLADTALLNDAYRTLKDPLHRTEYLLRLEGAEIGPEADAEPGSPGSIKPASSKPVSSSTGSSQAQVGNGRKDPSRIPADLLEEVFDLNMQLEEMRDLRKRGGADPELHSSLTRAKKKFDALLGEADMDLRAEWLAWDEGDQHARLAAQDRMVALLDRRRYLSNLVRDVTDILKD